MAYLGGPAANAPMFGRTECAVAENELLASHDEVNAGEPFRFRSIAPQGSKAALKKLKPTPVASAPLRPTVGMLSVSPTRISRKVRTPAVTVVGFWGFAASKSDSVMPNRFAMAAGLSL